MAFSFSSSSSILRCCISRKVNGSRVNHVAAMSTLVSSSSSSSSSSSNSSSPWLMLPPSFKDNINNMVLFKFHSLAEDKVPSFSSTRLKKLVSDDVKFVSSSHGWLTLFNPYNWDLFLFNPLTDRHIKLPPIQNLPVPYENLESRRGCIAKVITSNCSPEDEDCRVMMSYGPAKRLAFCCPTSSTDWTPIGAPFIMEENNDLRARAYQDFVYSSTEKLFYTITSFDEEMEIWDLQDIKSPKVIPFDFSVDEENFRWGKYDRKLKKLSSPHLYLVKAEDSGQLYIVRRHIVIFIAPDGSSVDIDKVDEMDLLKFPRKTIGFDVHEYDPEEGGFRYMDKGCLDGLAIFIGANHSFAIDVASANSCTEMKPNSIYFTDSFNLVPSEWAFGGHDIGIFNYEDQTFSPCYYPCDLLSFKRIIPAPMWFTPTYY